jgi:hypothetical protein
MFEIGPASVDILSVANQTSVTLWVPHLRDKSLTNRLPRPTKAPITPRATNPDEELARVPRLIARYVLYRSLKVKNHDEFVIRSVDAIVISEPGNLRFGDLG